MLNKITKTKFEETMNNFQNKPVSISVNGTIVALLQYDELNFSIIKDIHDVKLYSFEGNEDNKNFLFIVMDDIKEILYEYEDGILEIILRLKWGQSIQIFTT